MAQGGGDIEVRPVVSGRRWPTAVYLAGDCCGAWAWAFLGIVAMGFLASILWIFSFSSLVFILITSLVSLLLFYFPFSLGSFGRDLIIFYFWHVVLLGEHSAIVVFIQVLCNKTL